MKNNLNRTKPLASVLIALMAILLIGCASPKPAVRERFANGEKNEDWLSGARFPSADYAGPESRILMPFRIIDERAEYHVIAWFDGHDQYQSVEAFIFKDNRIRAILTRHDNSQIDAYNFDFTAFSRTNDRRERYTTDISFTVNRSAQAAELKFNLSDGQPLILSYSGQDAPDRKHGGLTDPGRHSPDGGLPIFFREASSVSSDRSLVSIGGKKYGVPVDTEISVPPFFTAWSAFLSTGYSSCILPTFQDSKIPSAIIDEAIDNKDAQCRVKTVNRNGVAEIASIGTQNSGLRFNPPLANFYALPEGKSATSRFAVFFKGSSAEEVYGTILTEKKGLTVTLRLVPEFPGWAKSVRALRYTVELDAVGATVRAEMDHR